MLDGGLRLLGAVVLALGMAAVVAIAFAAVCYVVLLAFRFVPLTGRHKNKPLDLTRKKATR